MLKKFVSLMFCLLIIVSVAVVSLAGVSAADDERENILYIKLGDSYFTAEVGDTVTFVADVTAAKTFENIQAEIKYDSDYLEVVPVESDDPDYSDWEVASFKCIPNLVDVGSGNINLKMENLIKFNASRVAGYDFRETRNLVNVEFTVMKGGETDIKLDIIWMMIKGGEEGYFVNSVPEITKGFTLVTYMTGAENYTPVSPTYPSFDYPATPEEAPEEIPDDAGTLVVFTDSEVYEVKVGQKFRYDILLEAERLFETLQGIVEYPSDMLEITRHKSPDTDIADWEYQTVFVLPNINNAVVNLGIDSVVKFNGSNIYGYNFKDEKVLVTLEVTAVKEGIAEIDATIQELIIKGGEEYYFDNAQVGTTDGLSIKYVTNAKVCENPPERPTEPAPTYPTVEGDVVGHFDNHFDWENVFCYTYVDGGGREDLGQWPGTPCEKTKEGVWTATIPGDCTHVVFNDGDKTSTAHLLNPLRERIAKRFGSAGILSGEHWQYSYAWFDYDPNPPTAPSWDVEWGDADTTYPAATDGPWNEEAWPDEATTPGEFYPMTPTEPGACETFPAVESVPCDTLPPTVGVEEDDMDTPHSQGGKPANPTEGKPVATQGATSQVEENTDKPMDVPATGLNTTALFPVLLVVGVGLLLTFRKRKAEN